jgi:hypothetical protein
MKAGEVLDTDPVWAKVFDILSHSHWGAQLGAHSRMSASAPA